MISPRSWLLLGDHNCSNAYSAFLYALMPLSGRIKTLIKIPAKLIMDGILTLGKSTSLL